jgi:hypothetical protein
VLLPEKLSDAEETKGESEGEGERMKEFYAGVDINWWYSENRGRCPNCGLDMSKMDPAYNIYPHFTASCKAGKPDYSHTSLGAGPDEVTG